MNTCPYWLWRFLMDPGLFLWKPAFPCRSCWSWLILEGTDWSWRVLTDHGGYWQILEGHFRSWRVFWIWQCPDRSVLNMTDLCCPDIFPWFLKNTYSSGQVLLILVSYVRSGLFTSTGTRASKTLSTLQSLWNRGKKLLRWNFPWSLAPPPLPPSVENN